MPEERMKLAILIGLFVALPALAEDPRFGGCPPARDANGRIARSDAVLAEFEREHPRSLLPKLLKADGTVRAGTRTTPSRSTAAGATRS
jgi:hypothetical protein